MHLVGQHRGNHSSIRLSPGFFLPGEQRNKVLESNHLDTHTHTQTGPGHRNMNTQSWGTFHLGIDSFREEDKAFFLPLMGYREWQVDKWAVEWVDLAGMQGGWYAPQRRTRVDISHGTVPE